MVEFGTRLRALRKQRNLTQKQLAELVGVQNSIISFYEVGDRTPSIELIIAFSRVFHVSTDYLLGIDRGETVDISDLSSEDKLLAITMVDSLRSKNNYKKILDKSKK